MTVVQARLADLFPGLSDPIAKDQPTWMEWAFGCVRSRAFRLGRDRFAFVPFLDAANHDARPNAAFRESGGCVELVAVADARSGDEATISYCEPGR